MTLDLFLLSHVVKWAEIKVYSDILYTLVQHEKGTLASNARSFFLTRESLSLSVIIKIHLLNAVVSLPLQLFLKQQLALESQHDKKRFNQTMSR